MILKDDRANRILAGVHLAKITDVRMALDGEKNDLTNHGGDRAIEITFKSKTGPSIKHIFWLTEQGQWIIDKLLKALEITGMKREIDAEVLIGKKLYIVVANEYHIKGEQPVLDSQNKPLFYPRMTTYFFSIKSEWPMIEGDPSDGSEPKGIFRIEKQVI